MPAQKRSHEELEDDPTQNKQENGHGGPEEEEESDRSPSLSNENKKEYMDIKLAEIRKSVQCPICLGIIRKTRTVMECLHRFCRECIDKSMRLGNNECPACRTHCASRRSLRDDPNYDNLIAALYPNIDEYEKEELAFQEEEKDRNKQIQANIAQTMRRQSEALGRKRTTPAKGASFPRRSQGSYRNLRGRRNSRNAVDNQGSDDNEDANGNDGGKDSSSADEQTEPRPRRKRWGGARYYLPSSAGAGADGGGDENDSELNRETMGASLGLISSSERLAWGKGGMRSHTHTRHGSNSGGNGKNARNNRISKLADSLRNSEENDEFNIQLMLVSVNEETIPSLLRPYLCCEPTMSVKNLSQYVALQAALQADEIELYLIKELDDQFNPSTSTKVPVFKSGVLESKEKLQVLREEETLAELNTHSSANGYLVLAYQKKWSSMRQS
ncbi:hypothetical protein UlMin_017079 [Ulmus minor]